MNNKFQLFLRGFVFGICMFLLMNLGKYDEMNSFLWLSIILGSSLIGYCSMRFANRFWKDFGFDEKPF